MTPEEIFNKVFDILVAHAGVADTKAKREDFLFHLCGDSTTEYRFQGNLGFGGKFRRHGGEHYIYCYPEDLTPERQKIIDLVNQELETVPYYCPPTRFLGDKNGKH